MSERLELRVEVERSKRRVEAGSPIADLLVYLQLHALSSAIQLYNEGTILR